MLETFRLTAHRAAVWFVAMRAAGNTAAHTALLPTAALRQCLIGTFLHRQRFSDVQCFCAPCRFPCFPVAVGLAQRKPPYGSVSMGDSWGKFL